MPIQHKCPDCGADMAFDADKGTLCCPGCGLQINLEEYQEAPPETEGEFEEFESQTFAGQFEADASKQYHCNNCGAVLITDNDTAATTCSFCGAPMILGDRLDGVLCPSKVIPFSVSRREAEEAFRKWCRKGLLTPKGFMSAERMKSITGMYVPFWLYDLNVRGEAFADCTRVRTYEDASYLYTETRHYQVYRKADINYLKVPADASEKMDDHMMDLLEPFNYNDLKDFKTPYLAGYLAEKYNYTDSQLLPRVKGRAEQYMDQYLRSSIHGYSSAIINRSWNEVRQKNAYYTLLPVWMICYDYEHSEHNFLMNGQTGKIVGKPPYSYGKAAAWFAGISVSVFLILEILTLLAGGGF